MACLMVGTMVLMLATPDFTLDWEHSVERTRWRESWRIEGGTLRLVEAAVKGSGAGMEPGEGAVLRDGWWVWQPMLAPLPALALAASGATRSGWRLCSGGICRMLGAAPDQPVVLRPCPT